MQVVLDQQRARAAERALPMLRQQRLHVGAAADRLDGSGRKARPWSHSSPDAPGGSLGDAGRRLVLANGSDRIVQLDLLLHRPIPFIWRRSLRRRWRTRWSTTATVTREMHSSRAISLLP